MNVQSRIATFEKANRPAAEQPTGKLSQSPIQPIQKPVTQKPVTQKPVTQKSKTPERPKSHTSLASQSRKHRLSLAVAHAKDLRTEPEKPKQEKKIVSKATSKATRSTVVSKITARQQQKQQLQQQQQKQQLQQKQQQQQLKEEQQKIKTLSHRRRELSKRHFVAQQAKKRSTEQQTPQHKLSASGMANMADSVRRVAVPKKKRSTSPLFLPLEHATTAITPERLVVQPSSSSDNMESHNSTMEEDNDDHTLDYGILHNNTAVSRAPTIMTNEDDSIASLPLPPPPVPTTRTNVTTPTSQSEHTGLSPMAQTAAGVVVMGTVGCILIGLPGVLVGAAAVGIGVGALQIPAEQRHNISNKAQSALESLQTNCWQASEQVCAGQSDCIDETCGPTTVVTRTPSTMTVPEEKTDASVVVEENNRSPGRNATNTRKQTAAVLRPGAVLLPLRIYSLPPPQQPGAWLDVLASADTSHQDKMEAMEEILILAKDKHTSQIFLQEGILDSLLWMIGRFLEQEIISTQNREAALLAASCAVTLGKAHCAAVHTEGNLMLMSRYDRGTVPEERQLAQLLHEVPHWSVSDVLAPQQLSLPQAEELAKSIKGLADQR